MPGVISPGAPGFIGKGIAATAPSGAFVILCKDFYRKDFCRQSYGLLQQGELLTIGWFWKTFGV